MARLTNLPAELLLPILAHLSIIDLPTFLTSQATCRLFRLVARDVLCRPPALYWETLMAEEDCMDSGSYPNFLLAHKFQYLFRSATCFSNEERQRIRWFLTLNGDVTLPFRRLPWARDARMRDKYLRPAASWQNLSVTFGFSPPITHVEIIKSYSSEDLNEDGRDHVQYLQVDIPDGGFLTMGLLYNLLLCGGAVGDIRAATLGNETGSWELLLGARLRSYDLLVEYECFIADDEDLVDDGPGAARSAILYVVGGTIEGQDQDRRFTELEEDEVDWVPERIPGNVPSIRLAASV
ncbi:hypothetical protein VM1G_07760 [Cytospora mali]|uniref:F-box domain-containing protein n=1 Tax=Cytospora mali TaxID=578113 RepID=A0A194W891_CYTMA|nr:hypothetical protein VM1G_07760 [Valsa mali]